MAKKIILSAFLVLVILSASIYLMMPEKVKINIENTRTKYSIWEDDTWKLGATEYVNLYDGSKKMRAKSRNVVTNTTGDITTVTRKSIWKDNITTIQDYVFDSSLNDVELFPTENKFRCINCVGKIVHYEIRDIVYEGVTKKISSPFSFGRRMKVEWQEGAYYSKVFQQKVASDKIIIKYRPSSNDELFNVRLYDPFWYGVNSTANISLGTNLTLELGAQINLTANLSGASTVCVDIKHPSYNNITSINVTVENATAFSCLGKVANCALGVDANYSTALTNNQSFGIFLAENYTLPEADITVNLTWLIISTHDSAVVCWNYTAEAYVDFTGTTGDQLRTKQIPAECVNGTDVQTRISTSGVGSGINESRLVSTSPLLDFNSDFCGSPDVNFLFNISFFRKEQLNNSNIIQNMTWNTGAGSRVIGLTGHQYDEVQNLSINISGFLNSTGGTSPTDVQIFINGSLSNDIGDLFSGDILLDRFNEAGGLERFPEDVKVVGTCAVGEPCSDAFDEDFTTQGCTPFIPESNVTFFKNYTIPVGAISANLTFLSDAFVLLSCHNSTGFQFIGSGAHPVQIEDTIPGICFDDDEVLLIQIELEDDEFDDKCHWEDFVSWEVTGQSKDFTFETPGTQIGFFSLRNGLQFDEVTFNVTGLRSEGIDQEVESAGRAYVLGVAFHSQEFIPKKNNLTRVSVFLSKSGSPTSDVDFEIGSTVDSSDIFSGTIDADDIEEFNAEWIEVDLPDTTNLTIGQSYWISLTQTPGQGNIFWWGTSANVYDGTFNFGGIIQVGDAAFRTHYKSFPRNITIELGNVDGIYEWNFTGEYGSKQRTDNLNESMLNYTSGCSGSCNVPLYITSEEIGVVQIDAINITYTNDPNPIFLNVDLIQAFLGNSTNFIDIPLTFTSNSSGIIQVSDINYDYAGGNDTIEIEVFEPTNLSNNETISILHFYSDWDFLFPPFVNWLEFIPPRPDSKNVTPFGQRSLTSIFNITTTNYGGRNMNLSISMNETFDCVNLTYNINSTKPDINILNSTWVSLGDELEYLNNTNVWLWTDYNCSFSSWRLFNPYISIRGCCVDCICPDDLI